MKAFLKKLIFSIKFDKVAGTWDLKSGHEKRRGSKSTFFDKFVQIVDYYAVDFSYFQIIIK
jgi:hypothetical protein